MTDPAAMPFPVSPQYRIRSDLAPLTGPHTIRDRHAAAYADAKRAILARAPQRHRALAPQADDEGLRAALARMGAVLEREQEIPAPEAPTGSHVDHDVISRADRLALAMQEDLVVMRAGVGAELLHVCFPSHWDPGAHAGSTLAALHGPVPHGGRLRAASGNLLRAMIEKGPFERWVWSVNAVGTLSQHPDVPRPEPHEGPLLDQLFFRVERQTTIPMPDLGRSVFTIRIFQAPLADVLRVEPGRAARLAETLDSMDGELRGYKGLASFGARLWSELSAL